jgi:YgiT-type zinc finger domain-containing protein
MENQEEIMMPFKHCPVCGGEMCSKTVEKLLRGGNNTATVRVKAEVCTHCGERLYSKNQIVSFEEIRRKLEKTRVAGLRPVGRSYQVAV